MNPSEICPKCEGSGVRILDSGLRSSGTCPACSGSGKHVRTVWTWSICYQVKLSAGPYVARSSDGGPYGSRENAIAAAHAARGYLMNMHGKRNVGRYELRTHQAPVSQKTMEEAFPEKIEKLRQDYPGLFTEAPATH